MSDVQAQEKERRLSKVDCSINEETNRYDVGEF